MKPDEQMKSMLSWLTATSHDSQSAKFDMAVGDANKGEYFRRDGLNALTVEDIQRRAGYFRLANTKGVQQAPRSLNIYISSAKSQPQSWLMLDDLTIDQCRQIAGERTAMIIQTSASSHHLWLATSRPVSVAERKLCQQVLQQKYGGDACCTSGDHLGRLPGFKSAKRNCWVNYISGVITERRAEVDKLLAMAEEMGLSSLSPMGLGDLCQPQAVDLSLNVVSSRRAGSASPARSTQPATASSAPYQPSSRDESHAEFAFACAHYLKNLNIEDGIQKLAQRALDRGKRKNWHSAEVYARRTFNSAERASKN